MEISGIPLVPLKLIEFTKKILCPPVKIPGIFVNSVDPLTGFEIPGSSTPLKLVPRKCWLGQCDRCGWDNRFAKFPLLPLSLKEDNDIERKVFVRACPVEATLDLKTTYHEFRKMERGTPRRMANYILNPSGHP